MKRVVAYAKPYWKKIAMILVSIAFKQGAPQGWLGNSHPVKHTLT